MAHDRKHYFDDREKIRVVKNWISAQKDGMRQTDFCNEMGVSSTMLYRWRKLYCAQLTTGTRA